jgi:hypothetical protein
MRLVESEKWAAFYIYTSKMLAILQFSNTFVQRIGARRHDHTGELYSVHKLDTY